MKVLLTKRIQFEKENFKIICLRIQLNFIEDFIEFMEGLVDRGLRGSGTSPKWPTLPAIFLHKTKTVRFYPIR